MSAAMKDEYQIPRSHKPEQYPLMPGGVDYETFTFAMQREQNLAKAAANWRKACFFTLLMTFISMGFNYWQSTQAQLLPYIIEVDNSGSAKAVGLMPTVRYIPRDAEIHFFLFQFLSKLRSVPMDKVVQHKNVSDAYMFLSDKAKLKVNELLRQEVSQREKDMTSLLELRSITKIAGSDNSYNVRWTEKVFSPSGSLEKSNNMFCNLTIKIDTPKDELSLIANPLGIYIKDLSWSLES